MRESLGEEWSRDHRKQGAITSAGVDTAVSRRKEVRGVLSHERTRRESAGPDYGGSVATTFPVLLPEHRHPGERAHSGLRGQDTPNGVYLRPRCLGEQVSIAQCRD